MMTTNNARGDATSHSDFQVSGDIPSAESWTPTPQKVRALISAHYRSKRYYDRSAPHAFTFSRISPDPVFECVLETLVEHRCYDERLEPYDGSPIEAKPLPALWETPVEVPAWFQERAHTLRIPGTEKIRKCGKCKHHGRVVCAVCEGAGRIRCSKCAGRGKNCTCDAGYNNCPGCNGLRELECPACRGYGDIACYQAMVVKFSVIRDRSVNKEVSYKADTSQLVYETVGRRLRAEELSSLPLAAKTVALELLARAPAHPCAPTGRSDQVQHRQRLTISLLKNVAVYYHLAGRGGLLNLVGSRPELIGVPVRRNYRKVARDAALILAAVAVLIAAVFIYQWRSREDQYQTARKLLEQGNPQAALVTFSGLAESEYKDSPRLAKEASFALASVHLKNGAYPAAIQILEVLGAEDWPGGDELLLQARYKSTLAAGDAALDKNNYAAARLHYNAAKKLMDTEEAAEKLSALSQRHRAAARMHYEEGKSLYRKGSYAQAIKAYGEAIRIDPNFKAALVALEKAKQQQRQRGLATRPSVESGWTSAAKRKEYADYMQMEVIREGSLMTFRATGSGGRVLRINCDCSRHTAEAMVQQSGANWRTMGFTRVVISNTIQSWAFSL